MRVHKKPGSHHYFSQEEEYYGYQRDRPMPKSKYEHTSSRNIAEADSSKQNGASSANVNNSLSKKNKQSKRRLSKTQSEKGGIPNSTFYSSSNIMDRIEKACTTNSAADLRKQNHLLKRQIQKLQKECLRKDKLLLESKNAVMPTKQSQVEILELYRAIHFYEGKTKQMEEEINKLRSMIIKVDVDQIQNKNLSSELFEQLMQSNEKLHGQLEEIQFQQTMMEDKYKKVQSKYHQIHRELCEYKRKQRDPLNKNNTGRANYMYQLLKNNEPNLQDKEYYYKLQENIQTINQLTQSLESFKAENELLKSEIENKNNQITQMHKQLIITKKSLKSLKNVPSSVHISNQQIEQSSRRILPVS